MVKSNAEFLDDNLSKDIINAKSCKSSDFLFNNKEN